MEMFLISVLGQNPELRNLPWKISERVGEKANRTDTNRKIATAAERLRAQAAKIRATKSESSCYLSLADKAASAKTPGIRTHLWTNAEQKM